MNAPDPPHWTLNSCFGVFRIIWVRLGQFGCLTNLGGKRAELVQKFVPRSRIEIFLMNAPDQHHWTLNFCFGVFRTIYVHLGPLGCLTKLGAKRSELVQKFCDEVASEFFTTNAPDPPHWTLNSCFGVLRTIWVQLGQFGCYKKLGGKRAELVQKFVPRSPVGMFRNERTRSTHWTLNSCFGVFRCN